MNATGTIDRAKSSPALGAAFLGAQTLSLNAISLLTTAFIVRRLGSLQYGVWATASSLAAAHLVMTNVGLRTLFVREVARRPEDAADLLATQLGLRLALGVIAGAVSILVCVLLRYPPIVLACAMVGCVWILVSVVGSTLGDVLQARERFGAYSAVAVASGLAVTAASVAVVAAGIGPLGLTVAYLAQPVVSALLLWREAARQVRVSIRWDWTRSIALLREARFLGANSIASAAGDRTVQLMAPAVLGLERFGVFSAGTIIADRLGAIPDAVGSAFYPLVSRATVQSPGSAEAPVLAMLTVGLAASIPMAVVGVHLATSLAAILVPRDITTTASVIQITVLGLPLLALATAMTYCLQAAGRHDTAARIGIGASAVSVVISAVAVVVAGTHGASWALVARSATLAAALAPAFRRTFPTALGHLPWVRIGAAAAGLAATCQLTPQNGLVEALGGASAGMAVYLVALLTLRVFRPADVIALLTRKVQV